MATTNNKVNYSFLIIFFIVLLLSHEILHVEARHLKSSKTLKEKKRENYYEPRSTFGSSTHSSIKTQSVDGSDPSGPGHSPGVGHSIQH